MSNSETGVDTPGCGPMVVHIIDIPASMTRINLLITINDRMAGRDTHLAQRPLNIGETGRVTRCLSNLCWECSRESGVTLRRASYQLSHLWAHGGLPSPLFFNYSQG